MIYSDDQFEHNVYYSKIQTHEGVCEDLQLQLQLILTNTNTKDTSSQNVSFYLKDEEARQQGLQTLNKYHCQLLNKNVYNQLYNGGYTPEVCEFVSKLFPNDIEKAREILKEELYEPNKEFVARKSIDFVLLCFLSHRYSPLFT